MKSILLSGALFIGSSLSAAAPVTIGGSLAPEFTDLPYPDIGEACRDRLGTAGESPESLESLLEQSFVRLDLGLFELHHPRSDLGSSKGCKRLQGLCTELLRAQDLWIHWARGTTPKRSKGAVPEVDALNKWIKGWSPRTLGRGVEPDSPRSLPELLEADERATAALSSFAQTLRSGSVLGVDRDPIEAVRIAFAPSREDFVGLACLVGVMAEEARPTLWTPTIPHWTEFRWKDLQVLALEYADPAATGPEAYRQGFAMDRREKTGLEQHVVHHAMLGLCTAYFGEILDAGVEAGIPTDLVIELYGEDNARVGGSEGGSSTAARSKFVAGGQSQGGKFPRINADSSWRAEKGSDHFARALRKAQELGGELAAQKGRSEGYFALTSAVQSSVRIAAAAPFLGRHPGTESLSTEFVSDSREFHRAYTAAFVEWLRTRGSTKDPEEKFAALLSAAAGAIGTGTPFEELVAATYGIPLTAPSKDTESLEWAFLKYLSRRR